jgi:hypothetical protein
MKGIYFRKSIVAVKGPPTMSPAAKCPASGSGELTSPEMKVTTTGAAGGLPAVAECVQTNTPSPANPIHNATFIVLFML